MRFTNTGALPCGVPPEVENKSGAAAAPASTTVSPIAATQVIARRRRSRRLRGRRRPPRWRMGGATRPVRLALCRPPLPAVPLGHELVEESFQELEHSRDLLGE